jgi:hypothetical protein
MINSTTKLSTVKLIILTDFFTTMRIQILLRINITNSGAFSNTNASYTD